MGAPLALVDCNNFYASCERLFQPALRGRPVIVLSNNDGCVIARSNEAKALGIAMGEPWHLIKEKYWREDLVVRSSNYTLYGDLSARVMQILKDFTPDLEIYSIDEAFLSLEGFERRLDAHARHMRATVLQWTGIPVSVGIAPTKTLAKVANRTAKKDPVSGGICALLTEAEQTAALSRLEFTDLWGVAGRLATRLADIGIVTPLHLRDADPRFIRERFSVVLQRTVLELQGTPCIPLDQVSPDRKSVMASRSFGQPVLTMEELRQAVGTHTARAAEKMRRQQLATTGVVVFLHTNRFRPDLPQYSPSRLIRLPVASADTARILQASLRALGDIYRPGFRYVKAGVLFPELVPEASVQGDLWTEADAPARKELMAAMDALNHRFGRGTLAFGGSAKEAAWHLRRDHASAPYTTDWRHLVRVGGPSR
jgi:DNA polymerase V